MQSRWFVSRIVSPLSYPNWFYKMTFVWWLSLPTYLLAYLLKHHQLLSNIIILICGLIDVIYAAVFIFQTTVIIRRGKRSGKLTKNDFPESNRWGANRLKFSDYPRWFNIVVYLADLTILAYMIAFFADDLLHYLLLAICTIAFAIFFLAFMIETIILNRRKKKPIK
ncbi:hypothetical protein ACFQ22_14345 [Lentilactobacillus raoultii]|uniref:Integral membrane protein n=1 Tax=Lentilactobacillus raoultii TaxID=1987503 RepID=A0ABW3PN33_9LACO|nr:hypothetical protein [Lentilactobacillus raoultii]